MANYFEYVTSNKDDFFDCLGEELNKDKEFKELGKELHDVLENSGNRQLLLDIESIHNAMANKGALVGFNIGFAHAFKILTACHNDISLVKYLDGREPILHIIESGGKKKVASL